MTTVAILPVSDVSGERIPACDRIWHDARSQAGIKAAIAYVGSGCLSAVV